jgi:hypothetical protein
MEARRGTRGQEVAATGGLGGRQVEVWSTRRAVGDRRDPLPSRSRGRTVAASIGACRALCFALTYSARAGPLSRFWAKTYMVVVVVGAVGFDGPRLGPRPGRPWSQLRPDLIESYNFHRKFTSI